MMDIRRRKERVALLSVVSNSALVTMKLVVGLLDDVRADLLDLRVIFSVEHLVKLLTGFQLFFGKLS